MTLPIHLLAGVALTALALPVLAQGTEPAEAPAETSTATQALSPELAEVRDAIIEKWDAIDSYTADLILTLSPPQQEPQSLTGTLHAKGVEGSDVMRTRMEMGGTVTMGPITATMSQQSVYDGEFVYTMQRMEAPVLPEPQVNAEKMRPEANQIMDGRMMFDSLIEGFDVERLADESIDGNDMYVLQASAKSGTLDDTLSGHQVVYFDQETGLMTQLENRNDAGDVLTQLKLQNIETNVDIDDSVFVFEAPEGVTVVDQTGA